MKKTLCAFLFLSVFVLSMDVHAHPGRTDDSGGHTCRTNCTKWGLDYGEYHHHYDDSNSSTSSSEDENNYYESEEYKTTEYDRGYAEGFASGERSYKNGEEMVPYSVYGSDYYNNGYQTGYEEGYKAAKQSEYYYNLGEEKGYDLLDLDSLLKDVPTDYQESYSKGYKIGLNRKNEELKSLAEEQGYIDGLNLVEKNPPYTEDDLKTAYDRKYIEGFQEKLVAIKEEGFNAAYVNNKLVIPEKYEGIEEAVEQFSQGFKENGEITQIKEEAYKDGFWFLANNKTEAATMYEHATEIYNLHYEKGKKEALELYRYIAIGCGFVSVMSVMALLYLRRRQKTSV